MAVDPVAVSGIDFKADFPPRSKWSMLLACDGAPRLSFGRAGCGKFSETGALPEYLRLHASGDGLTAEVEELGVLPFGCEYEIGRSFEIGDGAMLVNTDLRARNFGRVGDVALEEVCFAPQWSRCSFAIYGETAVHNVENSGNAVLWEGPELPLFVRAEFPDGWRVEYAAGADLWRHRSAFHTPGTTSLFRLFADETGLHLTRSILAYDGQTEPEKRPWRFKTLLAWSRGNAAGIPELLDSFAVDGCWIAGPARRLLRKELRRRERSCRVTAHSPCICFDSAHLERPGKGELEHCDLEERLTGYWWGNHELARRGSFMVVDTAGRGDGGLGDSVLLDNLRRAPRPLRAGEEK